MENALNVPGPPPDESCLMNPEFSKLDSARVPEAYSVLRKVGRWLDSLGRCQRISKITSETYQQWQRENANYVASSGGKIIGLVTLRRETLSDWPNQSQLGAVAMMRALATDPDNQGQGIGAFVVDNVVRLVGKNPLYLDCVSDSLPDFYGRLGFKKVDRQIRSYPDQSTFDITLMRYANHSDSNID